MMPPLSKGNPPTMITYVPYLAKNSIILPNSTLVIRNATLSATQNGQRGLERSVPLGVWALLSCFGTLDF